MNLVCCAFPRNFIWMESYKSGFCLLLPGLGISFSRLIYAAVKINRNPIINVILWLMLIVPHVEMPACLEITSVLPSFRSQRILVSYVLVSSQFPFTFSLFSHLPLFTHFPPEKILSGFCNPEIMDMSISTVSELSSVSVFLFYLFATVRNFLSAMIASTYQSQASPGALEKKGTPVSWAPWNTCAVYF